MITAKATKSRKENRDEPRWSAQESRDGGVRAPAAGPIERVWAFLTDTGKLPGWFGEGNIEPRAGGAVNLMGGHVRGTVTQWRPPRRLAYTWNVFSPGDTESPYPEYLTIALEPRGSEVALTLTHLPVLERFEQQNAMGWHTFLDMLARPHAWRAGGAAAGPHAAQCRTLRRRSFQPDALTVPSAVSTLPSRPGTERARDRRGRDLVPRNVDWLGIDLSFKASRPSSPACRENMRRRPAN